MNYWAAGKTAELTITEKDIMKNHGKVIIINSIIWGLVLIGCSIVLRGTGAYQKIWLILAGGAVMSTSILEKYNLKPKDLPEKSE